MHICHGQKRKWVKNHTYLRGLLCNSLSSAPATSTATTLASWTSCDNGLVTPLVDDTRTHLALVPLLPQTPDKVPTVRAEGGLSEEGRHELVPIDLEIINRLHTHF